jgi:Tol biopolymer transport system component
VVRLGPLEGAFGTYDIYRALWNGSSITNVAAITALNSNANDESPILSADKLTLYFASDRLGGHVFNIWTAHRSTTSDEFSIPTLVPELNLSDEQIPGWLSPDNCRLYFISTSSGDYRVYVATRHPR